MAYNQKFGEESESKELAYDLRQGYAKLITRTLDNIKEYREQRDYKNWFEELDGLFIDISMKLANDEKKDYDILLEELNDAIRANPKAYMDKAIEGGNIYSKLKKINMWLLQKMEDYHIFGFKDSFDDGL